MAKSKKKLEEKLKALYAQYTEQERETIRLEKALDRLRIKSDKLYTKINTLEDDLWLMEQKEKNAQNEQ